MRPYDGRRAFWDRRTVPAGIVLAVVVGLLVWVLSTRGGSHHVASSRTTPTSSVLEHRASATPEQVQHTVSSGSGCHVAPGSQAVPQYTPQGVTWQLYQTVALPYSKKAGPMAVDGGVARCYAHDPLGALLAASQITVRYLIAPNWRQVTELQVMAGKGRTTYVAERAKVTNAGGNQPGEYNQFAGFKFVTYSPGVAVIDFVGRSNSGALQMTTATVDWSAGDWKLQLQPDGGDSPQAVPVSSLVGFATWSGV